MKKENEKANGSITAFIMDMFKKEGITEQDLVNHYGTAENFAGAVCNAIKELQSNIQ